MNKRTHSKAAATARPVQAEPALLLSACGLPADVAWELVSAGPSNRVFKVRTGDGVYALKGYGEGRGAAARFLTEQAWYELLRPWAPEHLPEPVVWHAMRRCALFKWVEGAPLAAGDLTSAVLAEMLALLSAVHRIRPAAAGRAFPPAAGACFCLYDRLDAVSRLAEKTARQLREAPGAKTLAARWESAWQVVMGALLQRAAKGGMDPRQIVPLSQRMLAAPEWGFHQAVRAPGGQVVFFDFDGAGWEDPAWWLAGLLACWELPLPRDCWGVFVPSAIRLLGVESDTLKRTALLLPARRFQQLCAAAEAAALLTPPAKRKQALREVEAALTDLARLDWWPAFQGALGW